MHFRVYTPADKAACQAICANNTPAYFLPAENAEYAQFLDEQDGDYYVVEDENEQVIACGGVWRVSDRSVAVLTWGMVDRSLHRRGVGRYLLNQRMAVLAADPAVRIVTLETTQHSAGFFAHAGFETVEIVPNGYGAGMNLHKMRYALV